MPVAGKAHVSRQPRKGLCLLQTVCEHKRTSSSYLQNSIPMVKRWIPLESNPEVLNDFTSKLGLDTSKYSFTDVYGLDEVAHSFRQDT